MKRRITSDHQLSAATCTVFNNHLSLPCFPCSYMHSLTLPKLFFQGVCLVLPTSCQEIRGLGQGRKFFIFFIQIF